MVRILVSFWDGLFSGAMLVSGRVSEFHHHFQYIEGWLLNPYQHWAFQGMVEGATLKKKYAQSKFKMGASSSLGVKKIIVP